MIMTMRKFIINIFNIMNPLLGAYLIYYKKINILGFLNSDLTKGISPEGEAAINIAIILVLINIVILFFKYPCKIEIEIKNNRNKKSTQLPIANRQKSKKIYINLKVDYQNVIVKKLIRKFINLNIKVSIPSVISYAISNEGEFSDSVKEQKDCFILNLDKIITNDETKYTGNIEITLMADANTPQHRQISTELYTDMNNLEKYLFYMFVFLFIDIEKIDHTVEIENEK